jgi:hypothetical protein
LLIVVVSWMTLQATFACGRAKRFFVSVFLVIFSSHKRRFYASSAIHSLFRCMTPFQALTVFLLSRKDIMKGCVVVELGAGVAVECGVSQSQSSS